MKCRSEWQTPAAMVRMRTSWGPGLLIDTSSIWSGVLTSRNTAAFIESFSLGANVVIFCGTYRRSGCQRQGSMRRC